MVEQTAYTDTERDFFFQLQSHDIVPQCMISSYEDSVTKIKTSSFLCVCVSESRNSTTATSGLAYSSSHLYLWHINKPILLIVSYFQPGLTNKH